MYSYRNPKEPNRRQTLDYRFQLVRDVLTNLHRGECVGVVGVGSCGKSRLLLHMTRPETMEYHLGREAYDHFIALVECNSWLDQTSWGAYEGIARALDDLVRNANHPRLSAFQNDLAPMYDLVTKERDLAFRHLMTGITYLLEAYPFKLTLCFDEFDFVFQNYDAQLFRNLRALRNKSKYQLTYLVATRRQMPYQRHIDRQEEVEEFYELFTSNTYAIGPYDAKDAQEMVLDLEQRYDYKLKKITRDMLIDVTGGHSGMIGAAFKVLVDSPQPPTTPEQMGQLVVRNASLWKECEKIWDSLREGEHDALKRLVSGQRPTREDVVPLQELKAKGLVKTIGERGTMLAFSPIMQEFARNKA
ncbi:MAG TPA: hypothetical protein PLD47_05360 [Aggregatilineales bacterium]|nr:hypothetical protein [Anaerolineales bacterium]HRE47133.1 hypothetical protein [Aggregatilineales bacterium]